MGPRPVKFAPRSPSPRHFVNILASLYDESALLSIRKGRIPRDSTSLELFAFSIAQADGAGSSELCIWDAVRLRIINPSCPNGRSETVISL